VLTINRTPLDTYQQKLSHLQALYYLACADNHLSTAETIYIKVVAERLGVDMEDVKKFDGREPVLDLPDKEYKLYSLFHRLAHIIMIDHDAHENEKKFCFDLGVKMGLNPGAVTDIIAHVSKHGAMGTSPSDVMKIFKKYLN
jgi:hypothetical protein